MWPREYINWANNWHRVLFSRTAWYYCQWYGVAALSSDARATVARVVREVFNRANVLQCCPLLFGDEHAFSSWLTAEARREAIRQLLLLEVHTWRTLNVRYRRVLGLTYVDRSPTTVVGPTLALPVDAVEPLCEEAFEAFVAALRQAASP